MATKELSAIIQIWLKKDCTGIVMLYAGHEILYIKLQEAICLIHDVTVPIPMIGRMSWIKHYDDVLIDGFKIYLLGKEGKESMEEYIGGWKCCLNPLLREPVQPSLWDQRNKYLHDNYHRMRKITKARCSSIVFCKKLHTTTSLEWLHKHNYPYIIRGDKYIYCV
jgi:hypothetical protein